MKRTKDCLFLLQSVPHNIFSFLLSFSVGAELYSVRRYARGQNMLEWIYLHLNCVTWIICHSWNWKQMEVQSPVLIIHELLICMCLCTTCQRYSDMLREFLLVAAVNIFAWFFGSWWELQITGCFGKECEEEQELILFSLTGGALARASVTCFWCVSVSLRWGYEKVECDYIWKWCLFRQSIYNNKKKISQDSADSIVTIAGSSTSCILMMTFKKIRAIWVSLLGKLIQTKCSPASLYWGKEPQVPSESG